MKKNGSFWKTASNKKKGFLFVLLGMLCLFGCLVLLLKTDSVFSTVLFYFSLVLNSIGLYILFWVKDRRKNHDKK